MPFLAGLGPLATILGLGGAAAGVAGSALSNTAGARTGTEAASRTVTTPSELQPLQGDLLSQIQSRLTNPQAGIDPIRLAGRNVINRNYAGADQALRDKFLSANGASGKYGLAATGVENARAGALSGLEGDLASLSLGRQDNALSLGERLLSAGQGVSSTGTQTNPGSASGAALGSLGSSLGTLATLTTLNKLLSGGGSVGDIPGGAGSAGIGSGILDKLLGSSFPASAATPPFLPARGY